MGCRLYYAVYPTKMHPTLVVCLSDQQGADQRFTTDALLVDYSRRHARQPNDLFIQEKHTTSVIWSRLANKHRHHGTRCPHIGVHTILAAMTMPSRGYLSPSWQGFPISGINAVLAAVDTFSRKLRQGLCSISLLGTYYVVKNRFLFGSNCTW
jgi:hypothetical protein